MDEIALGSDLNFCQRLIFQSHLYATAATIQPLVYLISTRTQKMLYTCIDVFGGTHEMSQFVWIWKYNYRCPVSSLKQVALLCNCKMIVGPPHLPVPYHSCFPPHETIVAASNLFVNTNFIHSFSSYSMQAAQSARTMFSF